nr:hypothetical protein [Tanacetum cinerariifolium]
MEEEDSRALKKISESKKDKAAKKQKLDEEVAELKKHLQIVQNNENDVYTEATPLSRKVPVVDYEIYTENNKPYYKIIRDDGSPQLFLSFLSLLRNFDREDLEVIWELVKERFTSSKSKNFSNDFLLTTLTYMFEKPDVQAQVWKNQRTVHGLAKVKSWKLLESCGVHIITFTSTQMIFLVERRYPLTKFTLDQMLNNVRLEVEVESKNILHQLVEFHNVNLGYRDLSAEFEDCFDNSINELNAVDASQLSDDLDMPELEDITYSDDVVAEADFNNLETSIIVSPIPTTRVHKYHPVSQIIGDLSSTTQTRSMTIVVQDQSGLSQMFNDDFHTCMFACFLSQEEPKRKVWILVDLPHGKRAIGTKWVYRNKKDERGIMVRNKARLVIQGHTPEEVIDDEEVFAPVARIEAIRLFLAYASFMGFMVYQIDVKIAFLYGTIEEEVCVFQPPRFKDPDHPDKVYKVVKALYGLHQAPKAWQKGDIMLVQIYVDDIIFGATNKDLCKSFEKLMKDKFQMSSMGELTFFLGLQVKQKKDGIFISQDKYLAEILRKFGLTEGKSASTPIDTEKLLLKDPDGEDVDVHTYRSMIGSLMYLTSSRPDIMFALCACAGFQVTPKASHLHAVKRIFRYLKGKPHLGLWYPKDLPFDLVAYSDTDYASTSLDIKSTTGGCQFLGYKLISWQCKKQKVVATSSTEAEYVVAASCCAQVLWI